MGSRRLLCFVLLVSVFSLPPSTGEGHEPCRDLLRAAETSRDLHLGPSAARLDALDRMTSVSLSALVTTLDVFFHQYLLARLDPARSEEVHRMNSLVQLWRSQSQQSLEPYEFWRSFESHYRRHVSVFGLPREQTHGSLSFPILLDWREDELQPFQRLLATEAWIRKEAPYRLGPVLWKIELFKNDLFRFFDDAFRPPDELTEPDESHRRSLQEDFLALRNRAQFLIDEAIEEKALYEFIPESQRPSFLAAALRQIELHRTKIFHHSLRRLHEAIRFQNLDALEQILFLGAMNLRTLSHSQTQGWQRSIKESDKIRILLEAFGLKSHEQKRRP